MIQGNKKVLRFLKGKRRAWLILAAMVALSVALIITSVAASQGGSLRMLAGSVDSGGGASSAGAYALSSTVGQPDAGAMAGGPFRLTGGLWSAEAGKTEFDIFLPAVIR